MPITFSETLEGTRVVLRVRDGGSVLWERILHLSKRQRDRLRTYHDEMTTFLDEIEKKRTNFDHTGEHDETPEASQGGP